MSRPVATAKGIAFAFPDVCQTPVPGSSPVPIPYPNIAQLDQASGISDESDKELLIGSSGDYALLDGSKVDSSSGDEAGSSGGVSSGGTKGPCEIKGGSSSVLYGPDGKGLARFMETTEQNDGNASGMVLSAFPMVLVGD